jgi:hypothetical protein
VIAIEHLDLATVLGLLINLVLPIVVGLVTRATVSGRVKALLLLFLSALTTSLTQAYVQVHDHQSGVEWGLLLVNLVLNYAVAVATHFGLWKPTEVTAKAQATLVK